MGSVLNLISLYKRLFYWFIHARVYDPYQGLYFVVYAGFVVDAYHRHRHRHAAINGDFVSAAVDFETKVNIYNRVGGKNDRRRQFTLVYISYISLSSFFVIPFSKMPLRMFPRDNRSGVSLFLINLN